MAIKDKITIDFLNALKEVEKDLLDMSFVKKSFLEKGYAYFIQFKKGNTIVEFLFGAPEFQIEMIIYTSKEKFAFRDLLQIPKISKWVDEHRYVDLGNRNIKNELLWFIELLKVSLQEMEIDC